MLRERSLQVLEDVRVIGFDDHPIAAQLTPSLTTVRQPFNLQASAAVALAAEMVAGVAPRTVVLTPISADVATEVLRRDLGALIMSLTGSPGFGCAYQNVIKVWSSERADYEDEDGAVWKAAPEQAQTPTQLCWLR